MRQRHLLTRTQRWMGLAIAIAMVGLAGTSLPPEAVRERHGEQGFVEVPPARFKHWDNPVLYLLMRDGAMLPIVPDAEADHGVTEWPPEADWDELAATPEVWRAHAVAVRGRFLTNETVGLARPSQAVGGRVMRWVVQWGEGDDDVAVVILPEAIDGFHPGRVAAWAERRGSTNKAEHVTRRIPLRFARVEVPARFMGFWSTKDRNGEPFDFPVFIAADAAVYDRAEHASGSSGQAAAIAGVVLLAAIGAAVWWRVNGRGWESRNHRRRREAMHDEGEDAALDDAGDELGEDIADDPAEALDRLTRRD